MVEQESMKVPNPESRFARGLSQKGGLSRSRDLLSASLCGRPAQDHLEEFLLQNSPRHIYHASHFHVCFPTEHLNLSKWRASEAKGSPLSYLFPNNNTASRFCWSCEQTTAILWSVTGASSTTQYGLSHSSHPSAISFFVINSRLTWPGFWDSRLSSPFLLVKITFHYLGYFKWSFENTAVTV